MLQVGFPLPDLLDMDYGLAELGIVEVRKGPREAASVSTLGQQVMSKSLLCQLGAGRLEEGSSHQYNPAAFLNKMLPLRPSALLGQGLPRRQLESCYFPSLAARGNDFTFFCCLKQG